MNYEVEILKILRTYRSFVISGFGKSVHEHKHDRSVVTETDRRLEREVRDALKSLWSDYGFFGEEYGRSGNENIYWLIDPIDGTENYIRGIAGFGTIIGLVEKNKLSFALVYDALSDEAIWAYPNRGTWSEKGRVQIIDREPSNAMVDVDCTTDMAKQTAVLKSFYGNRTRHVKLHGSAWRAMLIAFGKLDGTVRSGVGGSVWDYAPGNLLMKEAGAIVTYYDGKNELDSRTFSVLTPKLQSVYEKDLQAILGGKV